MEQEIKEVCKERFLRLEHRMDIKSEHLDQCEVTLATIQRDIDYLTKSLNALTKALWGMAGTTLATLLGFFIWYVQGL
jgi:uncharacterized coiled-coil protein SlyX